MREGLGWDQHGWLDCCGRCSGGPVAWPPTLQGERAAICSRRYTRDCQWMGHSLVSTDPAIMIVAISTLVPLMVAFLASGWRLRGRIGIGKLTAAGIAGGLIQGAAGVGGPPVVAVALSRPGEASQQRANVLALMTAVSLSSILPPASPRAGSPR